MQVLRESVHSDEFITIREKMEDLKEMMDVVSRLSSDRLGILEQAFALAEHFHSSHIDLSSWLDDMERKVAMLAMPALRPDLIAQQQDRNEVSRAYFSRRPWNFLVSLIALLSCRCLCNLSTNTNRWWRS